MKAKADTAPDHVRRAGFGGGTTTGRRVQPQTWVRSKPRPAEPGAGKAPGRVPPPPRWPGRATELRSGCFCGLGSLPPSGLTLGASRRGQLGSLQTGMWPWWSPLTRLTLSPPYHVPEPKVGVAPVSCAPAAGPTLVLETSVVSAGALASGYTKASQPRPCTQLPCVPLCPALCPLPGTPDHHVGLKTPIGLGPVSPFAHQHPVPGTHQIGHHCPGALGSCSAAFWLPRGQRAPASTPARRRAGPQIRTMPSVGQQSPSPVPVSPDCPPCPPPAALQGWHGLPH